MRNKQNVGEGRCFCRPELRRKALKTKTSPFLCGCGYKVGGKNHAEGHHHNHSVPKCRRGNW